ncbi:AAA family ATPase [Pseudomonas sp. ABC1]|uniref:AAA family ATPase n=1 Tax=Pseudomonas sp. ABC1 TaxID=2748080 RepID=UPI0015C3CD2C|nr:AAA family ATPase [Pseudomonas sp. ABC1]QLF94896.1 AAA family ATPase [Pseudomonas sp. ABC1]
MKLRALRVEQLRQFRQPVEIRDFQPGINLFVGPNESGKSTLVSAIRAAFFERSKSTSLDTMQPWGDSEAAPKVELEFDWQDQRWHLSKTFVRKRRCDLLIDGRSFNGDEAEDQLANLLGYEFSGRGLSKAEHWGIPGLLWVEQGAGQELNDSVKHAGGHLQSALGESLGELVSSAGGELIDDVTLERSKLLSKTGKSTGDLALVEQEVAALQGQRDELSGKVATYQQQVDRLTSLLHEQHQDRDKPWDSFRQQAAEAQRRVDEVDGWLQEQAREQQARGHCEQNHAYTLEQLKTFASQEDELQKREKTRNAALSALEELQGREAYLQERLLRLRTEHDVARELLAQARLAEQRSILSRELTVVQQRLDASGDSLGQAKDLQSKLGQLQESRQATVIDAVQLKRLRTLTRDLEAVQIKQQAVATRLRYALNPRQSLRVGETVISGQDELLLLAPTEIDIQGIGKLQISPGGEDLDELALRSQSLQDEIASLLSSLRVDSLVQAEQRAERNRALGEEIAQVELLLNQLAPKGVDVLSEARRLDELRTSDLQSQVQALPQTQPDLPSITVAETTLQHAADGVSEAGAAMSQYQTQFAVAQQRLEAASEEWQRLRDELNAPDRQQREQDLRTRLVELKSELQRLETSIDARASQIEAAQLQLLRQDVERFTNTAKALEEAARNRSTDIVRLQSSLEALGAEGLEEQLAGVDQELEMATTRHTELMRRAKALDLLLELLNGKRHALTQRLQAPLQRHLNRYLQMLFPQAQLVVNDKLEPVQLMRSVDNRIEYGELPALSFGAREQMGLISRLAYADLLQEAGRPTLIILDDALVHSDQQRLAQMKRVLFDASQRHQILLFSCHPESWRDLGVIPRDMSALKSAN